MLIRSPFLYFVHLDIDPDHEGEFNERYEAEHIPAMLTVPGVTSAVRYETGESEVQRYLAIYGFDESGITETSRWKEASGVGQWPHRIRPYFKNQQSVEYESMGIHITNDPKEASHIFVVRLDVNPAHEDEFNGIYNSEHFPYVMKTSGMLRGARFRTTLNGDVQRYMTLFEMDNPEIPYTEEFRHNADYGAWPEYVRPHTCRTKRVIFKRL